MNIWGLEKRIKENKFIIQDLESQIQGLKKWEMEERNFLLYRIKELEHRNQQMRNKEEKIKNERKIKSKK